METVVTCVKAKDWVKDGKSIPIYSIGLSDGRGGQSFGKEIPVGTPVSDLEIKDNGQYGLGFKLKSSGGNWQDNKRQRAGNESFALSYSKDLVVAGKADVKQILPLADRLYEWLESKKSVAKPPVIPHQTTNTTVPTIQGDIITSSWSKVDDLPF